MLSKIPIIPVIELLSKGFSFIIIILLTRILSIEEYGLYNYIVSLVLLISVLMDGGINNYVFNKSVKNDLENISDYFNSRIFLSFIVICLLLLFVYFYRKEYFLYVLLYSIFVFFNSSLSFFKMLARGQKYRDIDIQTIILDPFFRLFILSIIFFLDTKISLVYILEIFTGVEIIIFSLIYLSIKKNFKISFSLKNIFSKLKFILFDSKYFLMYYLFFVAMQRIDVLFISNNMGNEAVALFSSAYNLYMVILLFFSSYLTSGFKSILESKIKLINYIKNIILFYLFISIAIFIFSDFIYTILYPAKYAMANHYLRLLLISLPFTIISYFGMYYFNYIHKTYFNVMILLFFFICKFLYLFLMNLEYVNLYIYVLISTEVLSGITYFILLIKNMKGNYIENTTNK